MAKSKWIQANKAIEKKVTGALKEVEDTVVGGYEKMENAFVDRYLTNEGETVEQAKRRLKRECKKNF